jgi:hypothetical protein
MNKYHLVVITGYGSVGDEGTASFTVKADDFTTSVDDGAYRFYVNRETFKETVAMYPINRTILHRIEYNIE